MADLIAEVPVQSDEIRTKRPRSGRRAALKEKDPSKNGVNILAGKKTGSSATPIEPPSGGLEKENNESLSQHRSSPKKGKGASKKQSKQSFEKDLLEMQEKLQQLRLEKEKTEELLKAKDEILKQKEEELENRGREQENLQIELKKLQKLKEFKPTMVSFLSHSCIMSNIFFFLSESDILIS